MEVRDPLVAWLEDDDSLREETRKLVRRKLPDIPVHVSEGVRGLWECLQNFSPKIIVLDVMLPKLLDAKRLSEGVAIAQWIRDGRIPEAPAKALGIPEEMRALCKEAAKVPIYFVTGRSKNNLDAELKKSGVTNYTIFEKGLDEAKSAAHKAVEAIKKVVRN